jgi:hypothetical protein
MEIKDPDGTSAKVTEDNRLRTYSGQESEIAFQSRVNENAYSWSMSADLGADKCALYLRNDSTTPLLIDKVFLWASAAATFEIFAGTNKITVAGTAVAGFNLNTGAVTKELVDWEGALVLGRLGEIAINIVTDIALTSVTILGYFQPVS